MAGTPKKRQLQAQVRKLGGEAYIFGEIAKGRTLTDIAREHRLDRTQLNLWCLHESRAQDYTRAKQHKAEALVDQALTIADSDLAPDQVQAAKLRIETRRWIASKLDRATWGEDRGPTVAIQINGLHLDALRQGGRVLDHGDE